LDANLLQVVVGGERHDRLRGPPADRRAVELDPLAADHHIAYRMFLLAAALPDDIDLIPMERLLPDLEIRYTNSESIRIFLVGYPVLFQPDQFRARVCWDASGCVHYLPPFPPHSG